MFILYSRTNRARAVFSPHFQRRDSSDYRYLDRWRLYHHRRREWRPGPERPSDAKGGPEPRSPAPYSGNF